MKKIIFILIVLLVVTTSLYGIELNQLQRFANNLPTFVAMAGVTAEDGVLEIGVFSDDTEIDAEILTAFKNIRSWGLDDVKSVTNHNEISVIPLNRNNIYQFEGEIIWVLEAEKNSSLWALKKRSRDGIFTVGSQQETYKNYIFTTFIYKNKSDDPNVERWRLVKMLVNCDISPLNYSDKINGKSYYEPMNCD
jgi:hypothetical protein